MPTRLPAAALVAAVALSACGTSHVAGPTTPGSAVASTSPPTTTAAPATTAAPPATAPPSTAFRPTTPERRADDAANRLLATWRNHDRVSAGDVATPAAVAALFAHPPTGLQPRGCSDGQPPVDCTYADTSSGSPALYDLSVAVTADGSWYVAAVVLETA